MSGDIGKGPLGPAPSMARRPPQSTPQDPEFEARVRADFGRQEAMALLGATIARVEPGLVEVRMPFRRDLAQQHGFFHAGLVGAIADSAGGYAAHTLMPAASEVLTVEYKLNLLAPAAGDTAFATGRVVRSGRTLTVCELEVEVELAGERKTCAWGLQTLIRRTPDDLSRPAEREVA